MGFVQLLRKTFDICNELEKHGEDVEIQCPIDKGYLTVSETRTRSSILLKLLTEPIQGNPRSHITQRNTQSKFRWLFLSSVSETQNSMDSYIEQIQGVSACIYGR